MSTATQPQPLVEELSDELEELRSSRGTPTWEIVRFYPRQGEWTEEDYFALETNHLVEFDNGVLEFLPMPTKSHQRFVRYLFLMLNEFVTTCGLGEVLFAPYRVRINDRRYREPDIIYVPKGGTLHDMYTEDAALLVEIVSEGPENRERDLVAKRTDYAAAGIPEYWIIDPEAKTVTVLTLDGGEYKTHGEFPPGQRAASVLLEGFAIDVQECFAAAAVENKAVENDEK